MKLQMTDTSEMVADAFIENTNNLPQVNHKDGNKHNNKVENLEWYTSEYNVKHSIETKLRGSQVGLDRSAKRIQCTETGQIFDTIRQASQLLHISEGYLGERIKQNKPCHSLHFKIINKEKR